MIIRTLLLIYLVSALPVSHAGLISNPDPEHRALSQQVRKLLLEGAFDQLDAMAREMRDNETRLQDGQWALSAFYAGMAPLHREINDPVWQNYEDRLNQWSAHSNDSATSSVARAAHFMDKAWAGRGIYSSQTVSNDGWAAWHSNLKRTDHALEQNITIAKHCPHWYLLKLELALYTQSHWQDLIKLYQEAIDFEPGYYPYYFTMVNAHRSAWNGNSQRVREFVADVVRQTYPVEGNTLYARLFWAAEQEFEDRIFESGNANWPDMRSGFERMDLDYPDSAWNLSNYLHFACHAKDRQSAASLFKRLGGTLNPRAFHSIASIQVCESWANADD